MSGSGRKRQNRLVEQAASFSISLSDSAAEKFLRLAEMVWEEAVPLGLSGRTSPEEILEKDILDSLLLSKFLSDSRTLLDIGPGAGFPAVPLKILRPDLAVSAVESKGKAVRFLSHISEELSFTMRIGHGRAEEFGKNPEWKGKFHAVTGRAVTPVRTFIPLAAPFLKPDGKIILQKGKKFEQEWKEAEKETKQFSLSIEIIFPGLTGSQKIVIVKRGAMPKGNT